MNIAIDRGGTFTDVYANNNGEEYVLKLLSVDPANYVDAPTEGIRRVLEKVEGRDIPLGEPLDISGVASIRMGTTVATNGLLERQGDRVAFLVTKGFRDILRIGQQARPDIFDLKVAKLGYLYEEVHEIDERVTLEEFTEDPDYGKAQSGPDTVQGISGELVRILQKPDFLAVRRQLEGIYERGIRSLAISLLHAYTFPQHEQDIAKIAREIGFDNVSVSSELQPMIKLVSRANSATADAYLSPIIQRYIRTIAEGFKGGIESIGSKLLFMQSDGGLAPAKNFTGLKAILSGPAGGVVGYAETAYEGEPVLGFDMGGTSTDVSRYNGQLEHVFETTTAEVTVQAPQLDIQTVAAGGGSILSWRKGLFAVGPQSAGSHPGAACYRKGGPLTVTDANVFLGHIDVSSFPHIFGSEKNQPLDTEIVAQKFSELTNVINKDRESHLTPEEVAQGFLVVANEAMCRPIRSLTEGKGYPVSSHSLASFGGAGGQHACAIASSLDISRVIVHKYSSILSAFGIALASVVSDIQQPESSILSEGTLPHLLERLDELEKSAVSDLQEQGYKNIDVERYLNLRYKGADSFIMVLQSDKDTFASAFRERHLKEFGFTLHRDILVEDVRVRAIARPEIDHKGLLPRVASHETSLSPTRTQRMYFNGWVDAGIYMLSDIKPGSKIVGPAMILDETQTIVVEPRCTAHVGESHVVIDVVSNNTIVKDVEERVDPIQLSVFAHRFMSIAEQMGQALQKTAISTNIKERLDFSCAIFSPDGGLVANAPHIPVHLGSMSSAVGYQQKKWAGKLQPGDVLVANHPAYGGSHLPDITVITPVFHGKEIIFWAASRGHHSDIGGITAGSMPPFSKYLWQEGARIEGFKVVHEGNFDEDGIRHLLYDEPAQFPGCSGSRSLSDSLSDLKAQIAANNKGIQLLLGMCEDFGLPKVQKYMYGIQQNAEHAVRSLLRDVASVHGTELIAEEFLDDGSPLHLRISLDPKQGSAVFDFEGTGVQLFGNLNAPRAITFSAILYCLRTMISQDIPLNHGCLVPLDIRIPAGSFLSPGPEAATVGGNVETSQRVTDIVFKAFQAVAGSQGTCNNLTFGFGGEKLEDGTIRRGFGYYETICGGAGAGPSWDGQSGVQIHMTNTRATDPEILEKRYPVILHQFSLRHGSGGRGEHSGGDGVIRDLEFRHPVQVSILSERRSRAPYGLLGGECGSMGKNLWYQASSGTTISIGGKNTVGIEAGDHIVIYTPGGGGYGIPEPRVKKQKT